MRIWLTASTPKPIKSGNYQCLKQIKRDSPCNIEELQHIDVKGGKWGNTKELAWRREVKKRATISNKFTTTPYSLIKNNKL